MTTRVFQLQRALSGVAAIMYDVVRRNSKYQAAGYKSMAAYARAELHLGKALNKKLARAGANAYEYCRPVYDEVVAWMGRNDLAKPSAVDSWPAVPNASILTVLDRAVAKTPKDQREAFIEGVIKGGVRTAVVEAVANAREAKNVVKPVIIETNATCVTDNDDLAEAADHLKQVEEILKRCTPVSWPPEGLRALEAAVHGVGQLLALHRFALSSSSPNSSIDGDVITIMSDDVFPLTT